MVNLKVWEKLSNQFTAKRVTLIAVSKTKPASDIQDLYDAGQRDFGENYVQELTEKYATLPKDINWHFIGHLQSNKVKYIVPFVYLIHGIDNARLLQEVDKQAAKNNRVIDVLLQYYIAKEETKYGLNMAELTEIVKSKANLPNIRICGLMGMASNTDDMQQVRNEFRSLDSFFALIKTEYFADEPAFCKCSMGMSGDYEIAIEQGSNMVRIGSLLFGIRN